MEKKYTSGQVVKLRSSRGVIERIVAEDQGEVVVVCRRDEFDASQREHRKPVVVGFKKRDIVPDNINTG